MNYRNDKLNQYNLIALNIKIWWFLLLYQICLPEECLGLVPINEFPDTVSGLDTTSNPCVYYKISKRLICDGSINYAYLKEIQNEEIVDFVVENYEKESLYKSTHPETGDWYMKIPKMIQRLSGEVILQETGLQISCNVRLLPFKNSDGFLLEGEAFSNKLIKVLWKLEGNITLNFVKNKTVITLKVGARGGIDWMLQSNLTFFRRNQENQTDYWSVGGFLKSADLSEDQIVLHKGWVQTILARPDTKFLGEVKLKNSDLSASITGKVSPPQEKQITIPKFAFANMTVRNIIFKDSTFCNDFDRHAFKGLLGVKTITFVDSKLELVPKLNELLESFTDLEEIYIETCTAPQLKFGGLSTLKNIRKLSFEGSGPLNFDDFSFLWLKNSSLTFLSLRNCNVKMFVKANSLLWSVKNTLKHLDVSYSTLNGEKDLTILLDSLNIATLKAEGLKLKKIPTNGLNSVRNTLEFLSLRGNDFKKNFERNMFDSVFNFPIMPNLKELNLEECHINYIEKGSFDNLPNLQKLHLSYNNIENLQDGWTHIKPQLMFLNLSHNGFIPKSLDFYGPKTTMSLNRFIKLENLDLSRGIFSDIHKLVKSLGRSIRNLSLQNIMGLEDIPENFFENLTSLETLDLSYNRNLKTGQSFSFNLFKNLKHLKSLDLQHCRLNGLFFYKENFIESNKSDYLILENLRSLDLSANNLKMLDVKLLRTFPNLKILNLYGNGITEWSTTMFINSTLETLYLDENQIETITNEMFSDLKNLKRVKLGNNPFVCGSYVYSFIEIINNAPKDRNQYFETIHRNSILNKNLVQSLKIVDWSEKNYVCFSWSQGKFIPFTQVDETFRNFPEKNKFMKISLIWLIAVILVALVITIALILWKYLDVHLIARAVRSAVALSFIGREDKEPSNFKYNVFVSYCDKDRSWVIEKLLPQLESKNDVKVCLHERDFQVGLSIIENILNCIDESKNIILVVSQAFLKSQWCQYEMQLAQFRLLEKGRNQLVLIFLENIPPIKRPKTLRYLMMTKTYIEWPLKPKSAREIDVFWNRLMKSMMIKDC